MSVGVSKLTVITSLQNPKVKYLVGLRERRQRDQAGVFPVEGFEEISLAIESGAKPVELYYCPALFHDAEQARLLDRMPGTHLIEVNERVFEKIAYRDNPDGWLAVFPRPQRTLDELRLNANPLLVVGEALEKPGNLGAILRTADAAGADAVISCAPITDWGNPNIVRASKGALFSVQVAQASTPQTIAWLRAQGIRIAAGIAQASKHYYNADLSGPVAIAVGSEKHGLSREWRQCADDQVVIPMFGRVNSLNVATAAALLVYEAVRQRSER
jgi:RNA methyltransferase, TrmH family